MPSKGNPAVRTAFGRLADFVKDMYDDGEE